MKLRLVTNQLILKWEIILDNPCVPTSLHGPWKADKEGRRVRDTLQKRSQDRWGRNGDRKELKHQKDSTHHYWLWGPRPGTKECRRPLEIEYDPQPQPAEKQGPQFHSCMEMSSANNVNQPRSHLPPEPPERNTALPTTSHRPCRFGAEEPTEPAGLLIYRAMK